MLINTAPCAYWMIFDIFSRPQLLQEIRNDILQQSKTTIQGNGVKSYDVNVSDLTMSSSLISSVFQETLRLRTTGSSIRQIREDFVLADRYLLKKDSILQMPFAIIHRDEELWGISANEYKPRRFLKHPSSAVKDKDTKSFIKPGAFRGFGGGTTLCPGRHFAATEIILTVTMIAVNFDISPSERGEWIEQAQVRNHGATSVLPPKKDARVKIRRRLNLALCRWNFHTEGLQAEFVSSVEQSS